MPLPNEHAARQRNPNEFEKDSFRRVHPPGTPEGIDFIMAKPKKGGGMAIESVRFDKDKWPPAKAQKWLKDHNMKTGSFEQAAVKKDFWHGVL